MTASSVGDSSIPVHPGQRGETRRPGTTAFTRTRAAGACPSRRRYRRGRPGCRVSASRRVRSLWAVRQESAGGRAAGRTAGTGVRNRALKAGTRPLPWARCRL